MTPVAENPVVEPEAIVSMATISLSLVLVVMLVVFVLVLVLVVTYYRNQIQKLK